MSKIYLISLLMLLVFSLEKVQAQSLEQYLTQLDTEKATAKKATIYYKIGEIYQQQGIYQKALENYNNALQTDANANFLSVKQNIISSYSRLNDHTAALRAGEELITYFRSKNDTEGLTKQLNENARYAEINRKQEDALKYNLELADIYKKSNQTDKLASIYSNLGVTYRRLKDTQTSEKYFNQYLEILKNQSKSQTNPQNQAQTFISIGATLLELKQYKKAIPYFEQALKIAEKTNQAKLKTEAYNFKAMADFLNDNTTDALSNATKAKEIAEETKDLDNMLKAYEMLKVIYQKQSDSKTAAEYQEKISKLNVAIAQKRREADQRNFDRAIEVEKLEKEIKNTIANQKIKDGELRETKLEKEKAEKEIAIKNQQISILKKNREIETAQNRAILNEQISRERMSELARQKAENENQKLVIENEKARADQQKAIALNERTGRESKEKELSLAEASAKLKDENQKQKDFNQLLIFVGGIVIVSLIGIALFFVYRNLRITKNLYGKLGEKNKLIEGQNNELQAKQDEINVQNEELHQQSEEIMAQRDAVELINRELDVKNTDLLSSITYASRIQKGIMPTPEKINAFFPENFVLFQPRNIVSGDFYWFAAREDFCMISASDCTGHGVPGALMSMIASSSLNKVFHEKKAYSPEKLLSGTSDEIMHALDQTTNQTSDGMDSVVCAYYPKENKVTYAGAKNPLFYVQDDAFFEVKGSKFPVGDVYYGENREFTLHEINVTSPITFYLLSDGFCDQFGGENKKKFGKRQFQELIMNIYKKPMEVQRKTLQITINKWMTEGNEKQIDDILVVAFQVNPK